MERFRQSIKGAEDPRISNATRHDFVEMPAISLLSSLCGGQTCVDMADFAADNEAFLRTIMPLLHGPPSHDSFSRVFRRMDPKPFGRSLARFAKRWAKALKKEGVRQIAIDGKAVRRTFSRTAERTALHLAGAFAPDSGLVLGQAEVDGKSNEIRALPALLDMMDLRGTVAAVDAMHTQRKAAEMIIGKGGDFVMALKGNQETLHKDVKDWMEDPEAAKEMLSHQELDRGHGRIETRTATVSCDIGWLQDLHGWPGLAAVGKIEAVRKVGGRTSTETRYYLMSRKMSPEEFLKTVRNRWAIENNLHWVLDVQMGEDDLRNWADDGPENLAMLRRIALNIVKLMDDKLSCRGRSGRAAQVPEYRLELIRNATGLDEKF